MLFLAVNTKSHWEASRLDLWKICIAFFFNSCRRLPETKRHSSLFLHWSGSKFLIVMAARAPSIHVFLGHPLFLLSPGIYSIINFAILYSSILLTWPYHCSLFLSVMSGSPFAPIISFICSFLILFCENWDSNYMQRGGRAVNFSVYAVVRPSHRHALSRRPARNFCKAGRVTRIVLVLWYSQELQLCGRLRCNSLSFLSRELLMLPNTLFVESNEHRFRFADVQGNS